MSRYLSIIFSLFFLLFIQVKAMAQPFTLDDINPQELKFEEYKKEGADKPKGRISVNKVSQNKDTMYYFIKGLSMYAPTYFSLNSAEQDADIKINLCKENWKNFHRTGNVKGKALWKTDFKTEGDFGIMVVADKKPANYVLMVWTGDEMKIDMPSVFKNADGTSASGGGGWLKKNMTLVIVAAVALLIISFLLVKLKKKKS